jgi:(p)ppGpp synthase/HD superfamily hydrolase
VASATKGARLTFFIPVRVMMRVQTEPERIAAALHDVLEDTPWTRSQLEREGFAQPGSRS